MLPAPELLGALEALDRRARLAAARLLLPRLRHPEWRAALSIPLPYEPTTTPRRSAGMHVCLPHDPLGPLVEAIHAGDQVGVLVCPRFEDPLRPGLAIIELRTAGCPDALGEEPGEHSLPERASVRELLALAASAPAPVRVEVRTGRAEPCTGVCLVLDDGVEPAP